MLKTDTSSKSRARKESPATPPHDRLPSDFEFRISDLSLPLPRISRPLQLWFTWYARRYLRRHFHSLRVSRSSPPPVSNLPMVIYCNHASWWDPLVCLVLKSQIYPDRDALAPIDAAALARYAFLRRLGFYGIEQNTARGARQFLRVGQAVLSEPKRILALTPQGRFADARERPVRFQGGLGHLARRVRQALFVPLAVEYVFWEERLPEVLVRFGEPIVVRSESQRGREPAGWTALFEEQLAAAQNALALEALARNPEAFHKLLAGSAGQGGVYDWWRTAKTWLRGETFNLQHGNR